jgi:hypothetical protein
MTAALTIEELREAVALVGLHGTIQAAADAVGVSRTTMSHRYNCGLRAAGRGEFGTDPVIPGFTITQVSTKRDADGKKAGESIQQKPAHGEDHVLNAFNSLESRHALIGEPVTCRADMLTLYPLADLHLGLYAWAPEAGMNWDLETALAKYRETMLMVAEASPASALAIVLIGGDFLHADTNAFRTQSGNVLDGDGRTDKVIDAAVALAVFQIDIALQKHSLVLVRCLKGNHDEYASIAIVQGLKGWYRNDPRVTIEGSPDLFWWFRFGAVMLGATHGHTVKVTDMPMIMAARRAADWGATLYRYVHMFHIHHKTQHVFEGGAVIAESHQSPAAQDAYHHGMGYLSGRSMQSITYHSELGERGRVSFPVL